MVIDKIIKEKKGWLKILEAFVAILMIAGILLTVFIERTKKPEIENEIYNIQRVILDDISMNNEMRLAVLKAENTTIGSFIASRMPPTLNFTVLICDINDICGLPYLKEAYTEKDIYIQEKVISSTLQEYKPKKLKLFTWIK